MQVGAFQVERKFVRRILLARVDGAVEREDDVGILNLGPPVEHFRAGGTMERESPVGIPVDNRFVHLSIDLRFDVIFV